MAHFWVDCRTGRFRKIKASTGSVLHHLCRAFGGIDYFKRARPADVRIPIQKKTSSSRAYRAFSAISFRSPQVPAAMRLALGSFCYDPRLDRGFAKPQHNFPDVCYVIQSTVKIGDSISCKELRVQSINKVVVSADEKVFHASSVFRVSSKALLIFSVLHQSG